MRRGTVQEEKEFVERAFQTLAARGWFEKTGLVPTGVTDGQIAAFEERYQLKLPSLYRAFLQSYQMDYSFHDSLWGANDELNLCPISLNTMVGGIMDGQMEEFRSRARGCFPDSYRAAPEQYGKYLPVGNWDSDWLLWDLSKPLEQVREGDVRTWTLVSFPHDEEWDEACWAEGGFPCAPDFRTLLEWFFCGTLIPEFEETYQIKLTHERLTDYDFLWHWFEDLERWKEG